MAPAASKNLILCFDGTDNCFSEKVTNIVKLYALLEKSDIERQVTYYQPGIGTYLTPGFWKDMAAPLASLVDKAVATYLDAHVGLLSKANHEQLSFAYKAYVDTSQAGQDNSKRFKATFSRIVPIEFMGCWDTVASVGHLYKKNLPFSCSNSMVKVFRHAFSLDEQRAKFLPVLWHGKAPKAASASSLKDPNSPFRKAGRVAAANSLPACHLGYLTRGLFGLLWGSLENSGRLEGRASGLQISATGNDEQSYGEVETDVVEVWFAGCHADVGGGNEVAAAKPSLSRPSLRWMLPEAVASGLRLQLDGADLVDLGFVNDTRAKREQPAREVESVQSTSKGEPAPPVRRRGPMPPASNGTSHASMAEDVGEGDRSDIEGKTYDYLTIEWWKWRILEIWPLKRSFQDSEDNYRVKTRSNWGHGREIYVKKDPKGGYFGPTFHCTVEQLGKSQKYEHKAKFVYMTKQERYDVPAKDVHIEYVGDRVLSLVSNS